MLQVPKDSQIRIRRWLQVSLEAMEWDIATLERASRVPRRTIERINALNGTASFGTIDRLARAFGVEISEIERFVDGRSNVLPIPSPREREDAAARLEAEVENPKLNTGSAEAFLAKQGTPVGTIAKEDAQRQALRDLPYVPMTDADLLTVGEQSDRVMTEVTANGSRDYHTGEIETVLTPGGLAVRLRGQCMEPAFTDGQVVRVDRQRWTNEGFVDGELYYVHFRDGTATFKQVFVNLDGVNLTFVPLNQGPPDDGRYGAAKVGKYHKPFVKRRDSVIWAARYVRPGKA